MKVLFLVCGSSSSLHPQMEEGPRDLFEATFIKALIPFMKIPPFWLGGKGQWCLTLCDPMDYGLPSPSVRGILQARMLEWVVILSSGDLPNPCMEVRSPALQADSLMSEPQRKPLFWLKHLPKTSPPDTIISGDKGFNICILRGYKHLECSWYHHVFWLMQSCEIWILGSLHY